jgi:hypothetical protein
MASNLRKFHMRFQVSAKPLGASEFMERGRPV